MKKIKLENCPHCGGKPICSHGGVNCPDCFQFVRMLSKEEMEIYQIQVGKFLTNLK